MTKLSANITEFGRQVYQSVAKNASEGGIQINRATDFEELKGVH